MQIMLLLQVLQIILGASAGLRKATVNFIIYLCPSICLSAWNNSIPTGRIIITFDTWEFSWKSAQEITLG